MCADYDEKILTKSAELEDIRSKKDEQEITYQEQVKLRKDVENDINRFRDEKETEFKGLERFKKESEQERGGISRIIQEEKNKIINPLKLLQHETEIYNKKINNLAIIKSRLIKQFNAQNPDKVLPIELQQE